MKKVRISLKTLAIPVIVAGMLGCGGTIKTMESPAKTTPRQIKLGSCGDWRWTIPQGYFVGVSDAKADRMAAIQEAIARAREQVAARAGAKVYQGILDSANVTSIGGETIFRTLSQHVTDQAVTLSYPVAYFGIWEDNRETWYALLKFSPNEELQSLQDQRVLITAALNRLEGAAKDLVGQQLSRVDNRIAELTGPYSSRAGTAAPFDPHNCREVGEIHLPDVTFEGHMPADIMWTHPQPENPRYFLGISDKLSGAKKGNAVREATLRAREQVAAFLKSNIQQDFVSAYYGRSGSMEGETGGRTLQGALLQEVANTISQIQPRYTWAETFNFTGHYRSTVLMEFDYHAWMRERLQAEYNELKKKLGDAEVAAAGTETDELQKLRESVEITEKMIERYRAGQSGADVLRNN